MKEKQNNKADKQYVGHQHRPEIRDNLDSRKNEEQENKGDDVTHNEKDTKQKKRKE